MLVIPNAGTPTLEGHTPRGFKGKGTGLFIGDNLNKRFPNGDGVQLYLSFELPRLAPDEIRSAHLRSVPVETFGTPFRDLGNMVIEAVEYPSFSPQLWNLPARGTPLCSIRLKPHERVDCDLSKTVRSRLRARAQRLQLRARFEEASDSDNQADMAAFFGEHIDKNQAGLFVIELSPKETDGAHAPTVETGRASSAELPYPISTWQSFTRVSAKRFMSRTHGQTMVEVWVNPANADDYRGTGPVPVGLTVVKAQYGADGEELGLNVMVKMPPGYDQAGGDWYYGVWTHDGRRVTMEGGSDGHTAPCATCHDSAPRDRLFLVR